MKENEAEDRRAKGAEEGKDDREEGPGTMGRMTRWGRMQRDKKARMQRSTRSTMLIMTVMQRMRRAPMMMTDHVQGPGCLEVPCPFRGEGRQMKGPVIVALRCS